MKNITTYQRTKNQSKLANLASSLLIITFVCVQFIDLTLYDVGGFSISVQKTVAALVFPISLLLIRRLRFDKHLIGFAVLLTVVYLIGHIARGEVTPEGWSAVIGVWMQLWGAIALLTAVVEKKDGVLLVGKVWIWISVVTAILAILQSLGVIPLINVPEEYLHNRETETGFYRGIGLKFDPNFHALMLAIGIAFVGVFLKGKTRLLAFLIICLGIVATFSRMGLILAGIIMFFTFFVESFAVREKWLSTAFKTFGLLGVISLVILLLYQWAPLVIKDYLVKRFEDMITALSLITVSEEYWPYSHLSSAEVRAILLRTSLLLGLENWTVGLGAYETDKAVFNLTGLNNVAHNTFLELFVIGGIWGLAVSAYYFWIIYSAIKISLREFSKEMLCVLALMLTFLIAWMFLSLTYNSIIWLPLVISVSLKKIKKEKMIIELTSKITPIKRTTCRKK